eukprot:48352-Eustigmatos_ZCMA.PRE.1
MTTGPSSTAGQKLRPSEGRTHHSLGSFARDHDKKVARRVVESNQAPYPSTLDSLAASAYFIRQCLYMRHSCR